MKISENYCVRNILGDSVIVPIKGDCENSTGFLSLNESGKIIMDSIAAGDDIPVITEKICEKYEIDYDTAKADVDEFIAAFKKSGIII